MSQKRSQKSPPKPKREPLPTLPEHQMPEPYARLLLMGDDHAPENYDPIAAELNAVNPAAGAETLLNMVLDEIYYDYNEGLDGPPWDPRSFTPLHALRTLERMIPAANIGIEPLLPLLDDDGDWIREEAPIFYGAVGEPAIEPLRKVLTDKEAEFEMRMGASEALQEIGSQHPETRERVIPILEGIVADKDEDPELVGCTIADLMDLGAVESVPIILQAFAEDRVDDMMVGLEDVEEHFNLERTVPPRKRWLNTPETDRILENMAPVAPRSNLASPDADVADADEEGEVAQPYVAPVKVGRNEPCPCGSGKKYKKCHGA